MRVLFNTYSTAFHCVGGGEIQLKETKKALEQLGTEVFLFDIWQPQFDTIDIVHYFSVQGGSIPFCNYVKKLGLPLVLSPIIWLDGLDEEEYPLQEIAELLHLADLICPNSIAERDLLAQRFGISLEKFSIIYNGVRKDFVDPPEPTRFRERFNIDRPFILNVANIEKRKNQLRLIEAIKDLGILLVLMGNIRDTQLFDRCMKIGGSSVCYVGSIPHDDPLLKSAYDACEIFVLPSMLETPGLAALEAGARGKKIVVTKRGATREYFGNLVTYVDPFDVEDIKRGIITELQAARDFALRDRILKHFTWDTAAQKLLESYKDIKNKSYLLKHKLAM